MYPSLSFVFFLTLFCFVLFLIFLKSKGAMVKKEDLDDELLRKFAMISRGDLSPMSTLIGGIVAQEALKACSGKFHPTFQFFYFDSIESLGDEPAAFEDVQPSGSRYDGQIVVFGEKFQQKLEKVSRAVFFFLS